MTTLRDGPTYFPRTRNTHCIHDFNNTEFRRRVGKRKEFPRWMTTERTYRPSALALNNDVGQNAASYRPRPLAEHDWIFQKRNFFLSYRNFRYGSRPIVIRVTDNNRELLSCDTREIVDGKKIRLNLNTKYEKATRVCCGFEISRVRKVRCGKNDTERR